MAIIRDNTAPYMERGYSRLNYWRKHQYTRRKGAGYAVSKLIDLGRWGKMNKYTYRGYSRVPFTMIES